MQPPMMMDDPELDDLKREFLAEASDKVHEIETILVGAHTTAVLERVTYLAHQLKGAGGSYGYQQISADAAALEHTIERLLAEPAEGRNDEAMMPHVLGLRAEVDRRSLELSVSA